MERLALVATLALVLGLGVAPSRAAGAGPSGVVMNDTGRYCDGRMTVYDFFYENTTSQERVVRIRTAWRDGTAMTRKVTIAAGRDAATHIGIYRRDRGRVAFRSEGELVHRARLRATC